MERKLELKDIAGYLPHGLKIDLAQKSEYLGIKTVTGANVDKNTINKFRDGITIWCYGSGYNEKVFQFKPILRPLSSIYCTITHNRKEIVPLIEIANMVVMGCEWLLEGCKDNRCVRFANNYLVFKNGSFSYFQRIGKETFVFDIKNQYQLFDYLHELKIDYRGLIEKGLAIDVNTLDINPYK